LKEDSVSVERQANDRQRQLQAMADVRKAVGRLPAIVENSRHS
jgi:hypothetical protein